MADPVVYHSPQDYGGNEIRNFTVHQLASDPTLTAGRMWINTTDGVLRYSPDGVDVIDLDDTGGGSYTDESIQDLVGAMFSGNTETGITVTYQDSDGTIDLVISGLTASDISNFDTQVRTSRLDQMAAPTASVGFNSQKITGLADGTSAGDAVNKGQLDTAIAGFDWKQSVRVATTANGTLSTAFANGQTVDGVTLATGDRILIKDQSSGSANGIYVVAASGAPTRATDADASAEVTAGMAVYVAEGTTNADTAWVLTTNDAITLGTTALVFSQFAGANIPVAGSGLTKSGNTLNVGAGTGIVVNADDVAIDPAVVMRRYATTIGDGSTTSITVTHNLGTRDVGVHQYLVASPYTKLGGGTVKAATTNTVTIEFTTAPSNNEIRVVVIG